MPNIEVKMPTPPVLIIAFNRPEHAARVFAEIAKARPQKLYIAIDGPRQHVETDQEKVQQTITVLSNITWQVEVQWLVRDQNLGCKHAVSSAITWFFEQEEYGIVLEDDCLPSPSFFTFCADLLEQYKDVDEIMHINGVNLQEGQIRGSGTYYLSRICHVWGWASWRRAWQKYDISMNGVEAFLESAAFNEIANYPTAKAFWSANFLPTMRGQIDTWDYQWVYSIWKNNGKCIAPNFNLIQNIGFDEAATHTKSKDPVLSNLIAHVLEGAVIDPADKAVHQAADQFTFKKFCKAPSLYARLRAGVKRRLKFSA
ncbi:nucleotide-diphospho-sugar transferase [Pseudocnuella soli]|uniref:nucleotide-diphospho-sugar transferase n=1 Tax=Pseudocnuella soli TaxID=2502779 RepID=UPI001048DDEC|nr:nucleotide-diphospho-sugar transferase [Pseudocnuella soli]